MEILSIVSDISTYVSLAIAVLSLVVTLIVSVSAQSKNDYVEIDNQYKDLLSIGLKNPKLRDPLITGNYQKLEKENRELYFQYCTYAHMIWNFLETLYDFGSKKEKSNIKVIWYPVMLEENKLHYSWFLKNKRLFREEFQNYVINYMNELYVKEGSEEDIDNIYAYMLQEFPPEELISKQQICELISSGKYKLYLLKYKNCVEKDSIVGYSFVYSDNNMLFLDYLNILKQYQSCGYGSKFITLMNEKLGSNGKGIILEIEPVDNIDEIKTRRKNFYLRNGGVHLKCNYLLPCDDGSVPMELMIIPCKGVNFVSKNQIREFVKEAIALIHGDLKHTPDVINSYINEIPDYLKSEE